MTYRDELDALHSRLDILEDEKSNLEAKKEELRVTEARLEQITAELEDVRERVAERRLPLLDTMGVASPCPADWDSMVGDHKVRFCGECQKNVYNVISMTRREAEEVIREHEADVCMRLYQRKDGTILTADCPVGVKRKRRRRLVAGVLVGAGASLAAAAALTAEPDGRRVPSVDVAGINEVPSAYPTMPPDAHRLVAGRVAPRRQHQTATSPTEPGGATPFE